MTKQITITIQFQVGMIYCHISPKVCQIISQHVQMVVFTTLIVSGNLQCVRLVGQDIYFQSEAIKRTRQDNYNV